MCAQSRAGNQTDLQPTTPRPPPRVTFVVAFSKHLTDSTEGGEFDLCLTVSEQSIHHGSEGMQFRVDGQEAEKRETGRS